MWAHLWNIILTILSNFLLSARSSLLLPISLFARQKEINVFSSTIKVWNFISHLKYINKHGTRKNANCSNNRYLLTITTLLCNKLNPLVAFRFTSKVLSLGVISSSKCRSLETLTFSSFHFPWTSSNSCLYVFSISGETFFSKAFVSSASLCKVGFWFTRISSRAWKTRVQD